jgi:hypothetical protein
MGKAKEIIIKSINSRLANEFVKKTHYSNKVVNNSQLHFGVFYQDILHGVMQFGPSLDKSKVINLVEGTRWNEFVELNRMAFDEHLPRNSESRAISVALRLIKKNCPHIKWVISFADGMQCGDGTIYRASGFHLTGVSKGSMWCLPKNLVLLNKGPVAHELKVRDKYSALSKYILTKTNGKNPSLKKCVEIFGGSILEGFMFRYIYFMEPKLKDKLKVPILPFTEIQKIGGGMYKGKSITRAWCSSSTTDLQSVGGVQIDPFASLDNQTNTDLYG